MKNIKKSKEKKSLNSFSKTVKKNKIKGGGGATEYIIL